MAMPAEHRPATAMTTVINIVFIFGTILMVTYRQRLKLTILILAIHYLRNGKNHNEIGRKSITHMPMFSHAEVGRFAAIAMNFAFDRFITCIPEAHKILLALEAQAKVTSGASTFNTVTTCRNLTLLPDHWPPTPKPMFQPFGIARKSACIDVLSAPPLLTTP